MSESTCGVGVHPDDCLCDVHVLNVTTQISDGVHGMWMGRELAEIRDYGTPWTTQTMLNYFEDLVKFHDAWCESVNKVLLPDLASQLQSLDLENETFSKWKIVREYVQSAYNKYDELPLAEILESLCVSPQLWVSACTTGGFPKSYGDVDYGLINDLEQYCLSHENLVWTEMGSVLRIGANSAQTLAKVFVERHKTKWGDINGTRGRAKELMYDLSLHTDIGPTALCNYVFDTTGVRFNISNVTKIRKRNRDKQVPT